MQQALIPILIPETTSLMTSVQLRPDLPLVPLQTRTLQGLRTSHTVAQMGVVVVEAPLRKTIHIQLFSPQKQASVESKFSVHNIDANSIWKRKKYRLLRFGLFVFSLKLSSSVF